MPAQETPTEALVFPVGAEWHAVRLLAVREVVRAGSVTPIPVAPDWLRGVVNLRGDVVAVIDSGRVLGAGSTSPSHFVVADTASGLIAVAADGTPRRRALGAIAKPGSRPGTTACHLVGDDVVTLLDLDGLIGLR